MMRKRWAGALPLVMVAGSLVAVPQVASPAQAAPAPVTTLQPSSPIRMERFNYWSGVSTQFVRPVALQKKVGSSWRTIFSGTTAANGRYRFTVHTGSVDTLRSYAGPVTHKGKTFPALATAPVTVRPVNQSIGLSMASTSAATVTTSPGRNGRLVTVQRYSGGKWVHVSHARTNATGKYSFKFSAAAGTYRALAEGFNGAASMTSASKNVSTPTSSCPITTSYIRKSRNDPKLIVNKITCLDNGKWAVVDGEFWNVYGGMQSSSRSGYLVYERSGSGWKTPVFVGHGSECVNIPLDAPFVDIDKQMGGLCSAYASMWKSSGVVVLPGYDGMVTTQRNMQAFGLSADLNKYLVGRLSSACSPYKTVIWVNRFRSDDFAEGGAYSSDGPERCGYETLWYKKNGVWKEYAFQHYPTCADLAVKGVPRPPEGFTLHDC